MEYLIKMFLFINNMLVRTVNKGCLQKIDKDNRSLLLQILMCSRYLCGWKNIMVYWSLNDQNFSSVDEKVDFDEMFNTHPKYSMEFE